MTRLLLSTLCCAALAACGVKTVENGSTAGSTAGSTSGSTSGNTGGDSDQEIFGPSTATTLLVDNEWSSAADPTTTPSYTTFTALLDGASINYATIINPAGGQDGYPTFADLQAFDTVFWFSAYAYGSGVGASVSAEQETVLTNWLDLGGKTLFLYSTNLVYDRAAAGGTCNWAGPETDNLLANYIGALGDAADMSSTSNGSLNHHSYTVQGQAGFAGDQWSVAADSPIGDSADGINPALGVDVLATVQADPTCGGVPDISVPVATGNKGVGAKGTSTVVFVGFTLEDVTPLAFTGADFFNGALTYAGI